MRDEKYQVDKRRGGLLFPDNGGRAKLVRLAFAGLFVMAMVAVWRYFPAIRLSHKPSDAYAILSPVEQTWSNGAGLHVSVKLLMPDDLSKLPFTGEQRTFLEEAMPEQTVFWMRVTEDHGPNFIAVDLQPNLISLADDAGHQWMWRNQTVAAQTALPSLRTWLTVLEMTISNEDRGGSVTTESTQVESVLLFDHIPPEAKRVTLTIPKIFDFQLGTHSCEFTFDLSELAD